MVAPGSYGRYKPTSPSGSKVTVTIFLLVLYAVCAGYYAAIQPTGTWRLFSWHPLMMSVGMVAIAGSGAMVKKMGGYVNTKTHGILGWLAIFCNFGGLYAIYRNKENNGAPHLTSQHAVGGTAVMVSMFLVAIAGGVFLHPDFGIDKRNRTIRIVHKFFSRFVLFLAWVTMISGLWQLLPSSQSFSLVLFGFPLMAFVPFVLI